LTNIKSGQKKARAHGPGLTQLLWPYCCVWANPWVLFSVLYVEVQEQATLTVGGLPVVVPRALIRCTSATKSLFGAFGPFLFTAALSASN